ncbi:MAG: hypothetical protein NT007_06010 [Candidatus Kapabacteria bacterium]|nr:hypothetical protein [Candidatus Kapabacteria bacterium]
MKKITLLIVLAVVAMFSSFQAKATANCEAPYQEWQGPITVCGCEYDVVICYNCTITQPSVFKFKKWSQVDINCTPTCSTDQQVFDALIAKIADGSLSNMLCGTPPPCDQGVRTIHYEIPLCWYKYGLPDGRPEYRECADSPICQIEYTICWNAQLGKYISTPWVYTLLGNSTCYEVCPKYATQVLDPVAGSTSECFHFISQCCQ